MGPLLENDRCLRNLYTPIILESIGLPERQLFMLYVRISKQGRDVP
jgi:hypothetical protein